MGRKYYNKRRFKKLKKEKKKGGRKGPASGGTFWS
jgi:hypothetical protein